MKGSLVVIIILEGVKQKRNSKKHDFFFFTSLEAFTFSLIRAGISQLNAVVQLCKNKRGKHCVCVSEGERQRVATESEAMCSKQVQFLTSSSFIIAL